MIFSDALHTLQHDTYWLVEGEVRVITLYESNLSPVQRCVRCKVFPLWNGPNNIRSEMKILILILISLVRLCNCVTCISAWSVSQVLYFFFWENCFPFRQPLCVVYLSHKKGNLYFSDQKRVTLGPLFCGVVRPTDYSPVAIKFLQKPWLRWWWWWW